MVEKISIDNNQRIIKIDSSGEISENEIITTIENTIKIKDSTGINNILVDTRNQKSLPDLSTLFGLFTEIDRDITIALLCLVDQVNAKDIEFIETVCYNRSLKLKVFQKESKAIDWLKSMDH